MKEEFIKYTELFDQTVNEVVRKREHSLRVADLMEYYAKELGYNSDDVKLAYELGLLHDIGRFRQIELINSFNDREFDHAIYGASLLFDEGLIARFNIPKDHYEILRFGIENHNKLIIDECNDERTLKFAKLIRDADKIDILYLLSKGDIPKESDDSSISPAVMETIRNHSLVSRNDEITNNDNVACALAFIFEINNDICAKKMKENWDAYYNRIERNGIFKEIHSIINNYYDERMKKNDGN